MRERRQVPVETLVGTESDSPCKYYNRETGNGPFLRTRTHLPKSRFLFQTPQNSRLTFVGEQNAQTITKGE